MKKIIPLSLIFSLFSASALANFFKYRVNAETEKLVLIKVEDVIPDIISGKLRDTFHGSECWPNNERTIKVKSVHIEKGYSVDDEGRLSLNYTGLINYFHSSCLREN